MDLELTEDELFLRMVAWDKTNYIGKATQGDDNEPLIGGTFCSTHSKLVFPFLTVGAGTSGMSDKNSTEGLVDNHAYSVIESRNNVCGTGIDLLKVRNPWGSGEIEDGERCSVVFGRGGASDNQLTHFSLDGLGEFDDDGPGWDL